MQRLRLPRRSAPQVRSAAASLCGRRQALREVTRTTNHWKLLARDGAEKAEKRERFPRAFSVDTPEEAVAELEEYEAAGSQYAIVKVLDAADLDPVRLFAEEVMAAIRGRDRPWRQPK